MMQYESTILIVDDEDFARKTLLSLLSDFNYNLLVAASGQEALDLARHHLPDLVLLDVMMPDLDGYQVCQTMRQDPRMADIPIIMVTALDGREARLRGIAAGADDFIAKPFDRMELRARVTTVMRLNRYRQIQTERVKFNWVVDRADRGYLILDDVGRITYMNATARQLLGWEAATDSVADLPGDLPAGLIADLAADLVADLVTDRPSAAPVEPVADPTDLPVFLDLARQQYQFEPIESWSTWPVPVDKNAPRYLVRPETESSLAYWLLVDSIDLPSGAGGGTLVQLSSVTDQINMVREHHTFYSLIQHRMRTPIALMMGGLEILALDAADNLELGAAVGVLQQGTRQLKDEIEEILAHLDLPSPAVQMPDMVVRELPALAQSITAHLEIQPVVWDLPGDLNMVQLGLSRRFVEMILLELLLNARKFHPQGRPTVTAQVDLLETGFVQLRVIDDGDHLSPQQLAHVWNPFHHNEKSSNGDTKSMGLGLSTVATILWGVGGRCHIANRADGPGVVVDLFVPVVDV